MSEKIMTLKDESKVLLRKATQDDLDRVWEMFSTLSEASLRFLPHPIKREEIEFMMTHIDYEVLLPIVAVVDENNNRIAAVATLGFQKGISRRHRAEFDIVVHDDFQGKGLGKALTQHMLNVARAKGLKKVYLKTATENQVALNVYRKLGFVIEGTLKMEHFHYLRKEYGDDHRMAILL